MSSCTGFCRIFDPISNSPLDINLVTDGSNFGVGLKPIQQSSSYQANRWIIQPSGSVFLIKSYGENLWIIDQGYGNPVGVTDNQNAANARWIAEKYNNYDPGYIHSAYNPSLVMTAVGNSVKLLATDYSRTNDQIWSIKS